MESTADLERLSKVRKQYQDYFIDNFDGLSFSEDDFDLQNDQVNIKVNNVTLSELDPKIQTVIPFSDAYGVEGELGIVLSNKFMEHDAYSMLDALMDGDGRAVEVQHQNYKDQLGAVDKAHNSNSVSLKDDDFLKSVMGAMDRALCSETSEGKRRNEIKAGLGQNVSNRSFSCLECLVFCRLLHRQWVWFYWSSNEIKKNKEGKSSTSFCGDLEEEDKIDQTLASRTKGDCLSSSYQ
ncbi:Rab-GTPase-TBC domain-containing protein [Artemisia annua]|uniref:Rab-GTPase-TBC domain-containing protein n=1 Tax=Artemisia annua TaxID=35608 RepID=A0A2U1LQ53_ARTAN|nr:Rab-GTPase-TBC domain-containing protein [Artemisia annua]